MLVCRLLFDIFYDKFYNIKLLGTENYNTLYFYHIDIDLMDNGFYVIRNNSLMLKINKHAYK